jgi:hypothetical protein
MRGRALRGRDRERLPVAAKSASITAESLTSYDLKERSFLLEMAEY